MDGHFVSAISFGTGIVRTMGRLTQKPLDVHLMVENPLPFIPELAEEKVERVSVHRSLLDRVGSRAVIQIDGGVTPQNLPEAYAAGARSVVAGSAVFGGTVQSGVAYLRRSCAF